MIDYFLKYFLIAIAPAITLIAPSKGAWGKTHQSQTPAIIDNEPKKAPRNFSLKKVKIKAAAAVNQKDNTITAAARANDSMFLYIKNLIYFDL